MMQSRQQHTLLRPVAVTGKGYWTGQENRVEFRPAAVDSGIWFIREDLSPTATIPATIHFQGKAHRRTNLQVPGASVEMVEHVLATLRGLGVDNCEVGVTAAEMPGCDGSALEFVAAIERAKVVPQAAPSRPLAITQPIRCGDQTQWIEARPSLHGGLTIEYRLDYGEETSVGSQWMVIDVTPESFRDDLSAARTFLLQSEAEALLAQGMGTHVTVQDLLVFGPDGPLNNPLRFENECVRHKVLDVVGDLALAGRPLIGHFVAHRSGHSLNGELVAAILNAESSGDQCDTTRKKSA